MVKRVAIFEPDVTMAQDMATALQKDGFATVTLRRHEISAETMQDLRVDLFILPLRAKGFNGHDAVRDLRRETDLPLVMVSDTADELDQLVALRMGADDYLVEPSLAILRERVKTVLRRAERGDTSTAFARAGAGRKSATVQTGDLEMDEERMSCQWKGHAVTLTTTEFRFLYTMAGSPGRVYSRPALRKLLPDTVEFEDRSIDTHIKRIRLKLRRVDPAFDAIETLYGVGYRYKQPAAGMGAAPRP